jgi:WD40 repeat protein
MSGHNSEVNTVAFSEDSKRLFSSGGGSSVHIWEVPTGKPINEVSVGFVNQFALFPDDTRIATVRQGPGPNPVQIWNIDNSQKVGELTGNQLPTSVAISPDGKRVASAGIYDPLDVWLWDVDSGRQIAESKGHTSWVYDVAFSPDGKQLVSTGPDQQVIFWDGQTGQYLKKFKNDYGLLSARFRPDGKYLALVSYDSSVRIWNSDNGKEVAVLRHTLPFSNVAFSADSTEIWGVMMYNYLNFRTEVIQGFERENSAS